MTRTLADGTRLILPYQIRFRVRHYTPDFGTTWTTDREAAFAVVAQRKGK